MPIPKVQNNDHDFGKIWINDKVAHAFKILNAGDGALEIIDAVTHCPCVQVTRLDRRIEPGQTGEVLVMLDSGDHVYGQINQKIELLTNVPGEPELVLGFRGELLEYVERSPVGAGFPRVEASQVVEKQIALTNRTSAPVTLELATPPQIGCFSFRLEEIEAGQKWVLHVQGSPPYKRYLNEAAVRLSTNVKQQPVVHVNCTAYVPPRLELRPFPLAPNPGFALREVRFFNHGATPVHIKALSTDDPRIKADFVEKTAGREYLIRVVMPIGYRPPPAGHLISIQTDDAEEPTLKLPFVAAPVPGQEDEAGS